MTISDEEMDHRLYREVLERFDELRLFVESPQGFVVVDPRRDCVNVKPNPRYL